MRWTVAIEGLAMSRSTWDRKLSVTPARAATSRKVSWRAWRSARIRGPSCSSATVTPCLPCLARAFARPHLGCEEPEV